MSKRLYRSGFTAVAAFVVGVMGLGAAGAGAKPILMPTLQKEIQTQQQIWQQHTYAPQGALQPPAPPCPENGMLPSPFSSCGVPEAPATTLPIPGNMAYYGGHVQTNPHVYIVFWGWGEPGAFPASQPCTAETLSEGATTATLKCDPDGAGRYGQLGLPARRHAVGGRADAVLPDHRRRQRPLLRAAHRQPV